MNDPKSQGHIPVNLAQQLLEYLGEQASEVDTPTVLGTLQDAVQNHREGVPRKQMRTELHRTIASFLHQKQAQHELTPEQVRGAVMLAIQAVQRTLYENSDG